MSARPSVHVSLALRTLLCKYVRSLVDPCGPLWPLVVPCGSVHCSRPLPRDGEIVAVRCAFHVKSRCIEPNLGTNKAVTHMHKNALECG